MLTDYVSGGVQKRLRINVMVSMRTTPREHHVEALAFVEVERGAQRVEGSVGAQVQVEVVASVRMYVQAAGSGLDPPTPTGLQLDLELDGSVEDNSRPDEL